MAILRRMRYVIPRVKRYKSMSTDSNKGNNTIENESCGFYGKSKIKTKPEYIREPRWYEKYYK